MQYTVFYTTDDPSVICSCPIELETKSTRTQIVAKFDNIFRWCFGNTLHYSIIDVKEGNHYEEPKKTPPE